MQISRHEIGYHILRLGLATVFLWFGFSQLFDGGNWIGWVPTWAMALTRLSPETIVMLNGSFEVFFGAMLALNLLTRYVAALFAFHMAALVFEIGYNDIGLRDFGLAAGSLALTCISSNTPDAAKISDA